jgi:hypothetical protein
MRKQAEIMDEIGNLAKSIGIDSYECAALNAKVQQISQRIQGSLSRMDQLNVEKFQEDYPCVATPDSAPSDESKPEESPEPTPAD